MPATARALNGTGPAGEHGLLSNRPQGSSRQAAADSVTQDEGVRKGLTTSSRRVLWFLFARLRHKDAWRTHLSLPQTFIAERLGLSRRTVIRALASLESGGFVSRRHQPVSRGGRTADLLVLDRAMITAFAMVSKRPKCHIRNGPKCHIRSSSTGSRKDPIETSVSTGAPIMDMQGELFRDLGGRPKKPEGDNAKTRLKTFQRLYRDKYGRTALIPSMAAAMGMIKKWQVQRIHSAELWAAVVDVYLRQTDPGVVEAAHPLTWLSRRLPAILPKAEAQAETEARHAAVKAQNDALEATLGAQVERRTTYPGIREGESVEDWQARRADIAARRRAKQTKGVKWA